jgi:hypothetical protein
MDEKVKSSTKTALKGGKGLIGFANYLEESRVRRDTAISIRKDLIKGKKEYIKNGNDFYIIEALNKAWTFSGNPNIAPEAPLNSEKINIAFKIIAVIIEPSLFKESLESAEKKIDELISKLEAGPSAIEKAEPTNINETAENLKNILEDPEKYGFKADKQGLEELVTAAWNLTQNPELDPSLKKDLETRITQAKEILKSISETSETIVNLNRSQLESKRAIDELFIPAETPEEVTTVQPTIETSPITTERAPAPTPGIGATTGLGIASAAGLFLLRKAGGIAVDSAAMIKRASSGSLKDIALSSFLIGGLFIGGPFGAGLVLFALSPKFRKFVLAALFVTLTNIFTIMFASLAIITLSIAIILFIINAGAYVVPPGAPISGLNLGGGSYEDPGIPAGFSCPVPDGRIICGVYGGPYDIFCTGGHGSNTYWAGNPPACQWALPSLDPNCYHNQIAGSVCYRLPTCHIQTIGQVTSIFPILTISKSLGHHTPSRAQMQAVERSLLHT